MQHLHPCCVCRQRVTNVALTYTFPDCEHLAHIWCHDKPCKRCHPDPPSPIVFLLYRLAFGWLGHAYLRSGEYRRAVMMASAPVYLNAVSLVLTMLRRVVTFDTILAEKHVHMFVTSYMSSVYIPLVYVFVPWIHTNTPMILVCSVTAWISGLFTTHLIPTKGTSAVAAFIVDVGALYIVAGLFGYAERINIPIIFILVFRYVFTVPNFLWDLSLFNCFGLENMARGLAVLAGIVAGILSFASYHTWQHQTPLMQTYAVVNLIASPQTDDPFTAWSASWIVSLLMAQTVVFISIARLVDVTNAPPTVPRPGRRH